jgi:4-alpha-glucanotransferase
MTEIDRLRDLATALGIHTRFLDGMHRPVTQSPETLVRMCSALGSQIHGPADAAEALRALEASRSDGIPPVLVAWDGVLPPVATGPGSVTQVELVLEDGATAPVRLDDGAVLAGETLPPGYHRLTVERNGALERATVISAPVRGWRRPGTHASWGVGTHLAALRSRRSRSLGDLKDLETVAHWVQARGGDLVTVLPLLPTFNGEWPEPSPYSCVSRLFWSELVLELGKHHVPVPERVSSLDVRRADAEVRAALRDRAVPEDDWKDEELVRYARFRGASVKLGRNWREWPDGAREGRLSDEHVDAEEARFHLVAQVETRRQLEALRRRLQERRVRVGLDLAVGVHPDGYDVWSRQSLFATGMSVGAPPDPGFPSGQDWGFSPVHPRASREEGHRYVAQAIAHQAGLAGVLRVDHIMAWTRLYWIPHGMRLHEGTYVSYPEEELFAILSLESHRNQCEVVGENLGTVPPEIGEALPRHRIWGMYLAIFEAGGKEVTPPSERDMALIGTHDTPTLAGWIAGVDIDERVRCGLLEADAAPAERTSRQQAAEHLATSLGGSLEDLPDLLERLLAWLGRSESPLVVPWLEDLWLEEEQVNLPGTRSSERPNWQRPMARLLEEFMEDPAVEERVRVLDQARRASERAS